MLQNTATPRGAITPTSARLQDAAKVGEDRSGCRPHGTVGDYEGPGRVARVKPAFPLMRRGPSGFEVPRHLRRHGSTNVAGLS
jgi:hypothetical protein